MLSTRTTGTIPIRASTIDFVSRPVESQIHPHSVRFSARQGTVRAAGERAVGTLNAVVGYALVSYVGIFHIRNIPDVIVLGAGGLLMALMLARHFGSIYSGK